MGPFKKAIIFLFPIFLPGFLSSQPIISSTSHKVDYRIPYRTTDDKIYACGNLILREMAKDVLREPWLVRIGISFGLGLTIVKDGNRNQLIISLKRRVIDGDTTYRHFPVTSVLFPSHLNMKLRWANKADTSGYTEVSVVGKSINQPDSLVCILPVPSFDPEVDTLMIREVEVFYDSLALRNFLDRVDLIHDYYATLSLLDSLRYFTANLVLDNSKLLPINYLKVEELSGVLERIDTRDFPGRLLRDGYDPSGLMEKYRQMFKQSRSMIFNFMDEMHKTGVIPWDRNIDRLAAYFTSRVFSYVRRSYLMDQQQGRIYNDCLDHFFDHSAFPPEENVSGDMLAKMFPDAGEDTIARFISRLIYESYRSTAQKLMGQNQYAGAFSMMENGRRFIAGNPFLKGTAADDLLQSQAAEGIFNSYIGIASTCIRNHRYNMAESYLTKADQYAMAHAKYIRSDSSYRAVFSELFFLRNVDCDQLLEQKKYAEALGCYQQFEKSYSARNLALISTQLDEKKSMARLGLGNLSALLTEDALKRKDPDIALFYYQQATVLRQAVKNREPVDARLDSLAPVMAGIRYEQIVKEGAMALDKRQFTLAVHRLQEAKSLAEKFRIDRAREFDSLYRQAMKNYLIVQLSASQKKIWANEFDSAQMALQRIEAAGFDFGLLNDPDLTASMEKYKVKIREQHCRNLQDSVDLRMIRAGRSISLKNFVNAIVSLKQALVFAQSRPECNIPEKPLNDTLARYQEVAGYQQNEDGARKLVAAGNYLEAVRVLDKNQQAFQSQHLGKFGILMERVFDFTRDRDNPYLSVQAIVYYIGTEDYHVALSFLLLAHDQGLEAARVTSMQEQLGIKFAQDDYRKNPKEDFLRNIEKYIPAEGWFDEFQKTYAREWNRLGNAQEKSIK